MKKNIMSKIHHEVAKKISERKQLKSNNDVKKSEEEGVVFSWVPPVASSAPSGDDLRLSSLSFMISTSISMSTAICFEADELVRMRTIMRFSASFLLQLKVILDLHGDPFVSTRNVNPFAEASRESPLSLAFDDLQGLMLHKFKESAR